jgi:hypothetical protein
MLRCDPNGTSPNGSNANGSNESAGPNYTTFGGNLPSGLAGYLEELMFSAPQGGNNYWEIDDIQFSPVVIPEPSTAALLVLGLLAFSGSLRLVQRPKRSAS